MNTLLKMKFIRANFVDYIIEIWSLFHLYTYAILLYLGETWAFPLPGCTIIERSQQRYGYILYSRIVSEFI